MTLLPDRLLLVTDRRLSRGPLVEVVAKAVAAGCRWIWLRDRDLPRAERRALAAALKDAMGGAASLTIGGDPDLAAEIAATGVHLPMGADVGAARALLGRGKLIGLSAHSLEDARIARAAGADYVTLSPIYPSASKPGYGPALGLGALTRAADFGLPVLALGGVEPRRVGACLRAGAQAIAVMGAVMAAENPQRAAQAYLRELANEAGS